MSPRWRYYALGYVISLPHTIIGLFMALIYRAHSFRWHDGCLEAIGGTNDSGDTRIWGSPSAQTHGWLIFYDSEAMRQYAPIRTHERVHVVQGFIGGPLYVVAYLACHVWMWVATRSFWSAYNENPFEKMAYRRMSRRDAWGAK